MVSNAHEQSTADVVSELNEWADRCHHLAINCSLIALEGGENDPTRFDGMALAYGNMSEFLYRRVDQIHGLIP